MRKTPILTSFEELGRDLDEFPEFPTLAAKVCLKNFADAYKTQVNWSLRKEDQLKQILGRFILFLALASVGEYRILIQSDNSEDIYRTMTPYISHIKLYLAAKDLYQAALRRTMN